jgi:flagellar biosynthesis/type III secretory pathway M-ring protein FliF/YscJ
MNSISTITETYDPQSKVVTKEEITNNSESGAAGQKTPSGSTKKDETISTEYQVGKTVKQQTVLPGEIKSLSVAAFVDLTADSNQPGQGGQPAMIMNITDVEQIIRTALGLKESDSLKVVNARFHRSTAAQVEEVESPWPRYLAMARQLSLGLMAVCAVVALRVFNRARGKAAAGAAGQSQLSGAPGEGMLPAGEPIAEPLFVRRQIASALKQNPDQVRQMFLSWIEEKESTHRAFDRQTKSRIASDQSGRRHRGRAAQGDRPQDRPRVGGGTELPGRRGPAKRSADRGRRPPVL